MNYENTKITPMNIHIGEQAISGIYIKTDSFGELYGFIFTGDVTLVFDSKESLNTLHKALTELKEKWLVEEQKEVTARA